MSCKICNKYKKANINEPLFSHELTKHPYFKLGQDFAEIVSHA